MNRTSSSTRKRTPQLISPNDPRWDIQIGIPRKHLLELLVTGKITHEADRLTGKGGAV
ncbi:hypothetical protein SH668x_002959 [Planctomicrobium sp. SH668]|uniref:hypothetical protein n=1 Tax=Planctomicrobium sp. SH668 TaxID=3448126 RepID=UPI003F5B8894